VPYLKSLIAPEHYKAEKPRSVSDIAVYGKIITLPITTNASGNVGIIIMAEGFFGSAVNHFYYVATMNSAGYNPLTGTDTGIVPLTAGPGAPL